MDTDGSLTAEGKTFAGPALRSAEQTCKAYLPPAGGPPPKVRAQELRQELAFARCMRAHGVPNFPDPSSSSSGAQAGPPAGIDPQSPAFRSAARVCGAGGSRQHRDRGLSMQGRTGRAVAEAPVLRKTRNRGARFSTYPALTRLRRRSEPTPGMPARLPAGSGLPHAKWAAGR